MNDLNCEICKLHKNNKAIEDWEIARNDYWLLRHHPVPAPIASWLILDSIRHIPGTIDFNQIEASTWGLMVQRASKLVKTLSNCERVYLIAFGEGARHLHLHLIPRFDSDPRTKSWEIADHYRQIIKNTTSPANENTIYQLIKKGRILWK